MPNWAQRAHPTRQTSSAFGLFLAGALLLGTASGCIQLNSRSPARVSSWATLDLAVPARCAPINHSLATLDQVWFLQGQTADNHAYVLAGKQRNNRPALLIKIHDEEPRIQPLPSLTKLIRLENQQLFDPPFLVFYDGYAMNDELDVGNEPSVELTSEQILLVDLRAQAESRAQVQTLAAPEGLEATSGWLFSKASSKNDVATASGSQPKVAGQGLPKKDSFWLVLSGEKTWIGQLNRTLEQKQEQGEKLQTKMSFELEAIAEFDGETLHVAQHNGRLWLVGDLKWDADRDRELAVSENIRLVEVHPDGTFAARKEWQTEATSVISSVLCPEQQLEATSKETSPMHFVWFEEGDSYAPAPLLYQQTLAVPAFNNKKTPVKTSDKPVAWQHPFTYMSDLNCLAAQGKRGMAFFTWLDAEATMAFAPFDQAARGFQQTKSPSEAGLKNFYGVFPEGSTLVYQDYNQRLRKNFASSTQNLPTQLIIRSRSSNEQSVFQQCQW